MPLYSFTGLPVYVRFSLTAANSTEAEALAEQLGHETYDLDSLRRLGVSIEEISFGDPSDTELADTDSGCAHSLDA